MTTAQDSREDIDAWLAEYQLKMEREREDRRSKRMLTRAEMKQEYVCMVRSTFRLVVNRGVTNYRPHARRYQKRILL